MESRPALALEGVRKSYDGGRTWAVRDVTLTVGPGELVALLGGSGCGKTTTLKMINRLVEPTGGTIRIGGRAVGDTDPIALRRSIGYVFQEVGLFPHLTVGANVGITPRLVGWDEARVANRVDELLELVRLPAAEFRDRKPAELSGGQRQRVGFARALAAEPSTMLLDEAFGALDPITRDQLQREYREIQKRLGLTTVMVTHDMTEALLMADRIAVMRRGTVVQVGTPHELLTHPADDEVARLMETPKRQADDIEALVATTPRATDSQ